MAAPKRILMIRTGGLGDFILSLPVMRALRATWPDSEVEILGRPAVAILARAHVSRITSIEESRFACLFADTPLHPSNPAKVYMSSFALVVSFLGAPSSDFGRRLQSLVPRVLFVPPPQKGSPADTGSHATIQFLNSLRQIGIDASDYVPRLDISAQDREEGQSSLRRLLGDGASNPPVIVHPGSGGLRKNWPPVLFAETVRLFKRSGHDVVLLEGEADTAAVRSVQDHLGADRARVLRDASLAQVAGVIACSRLLVGNDSGISHLGAAIGIPVVCLFGPTDPEVWRPAGKTVQVLTFDTATPERVHSAAIRLAATRFA